MLSDAANTNDGIFWDGTAWVYGTRVKTVNGNAPNASGNVTIPIGNVYTGAATDIVDFDAETAGGTPVEGDIYVVNSAATDQTQVGKTYIYDVDTTSWLPIDPFNTALYDPRYVNVTGDAMTGNLAMGGNNITNLANPTNPTDAVNKQYTDAFDIFDIVTGNKIATITESDGTVHTLNETVTDLNLTGNTLSYTDEKGIVKNIDLTSINPDTNITNTSLVKDGNSLKLTDSAGNSVSILLTDITGGVVDTNTTNTGFAIEGTDLVITDSDGDKVKVALATIAADVDTNTFNTTFTIDGGDLKLTDSDANSISIPLTDIAAGVDTNTVNSNFEVIGTNLVITDSDSNTVSVPLSTIASGVNTNTTNTIFAVVGTDLVMTDSDGNDVKVSLASIASGVNTNTTNTTFAVVGTDLVMTDSDGNEVKASLASIAAGVNTNTTNATFAIVGSDLVMTDSDGNEVKVSLASIAADVDTNTTNTTFAVVGTDLVITDSEGNEVKAPLASIASGVDTNTTNATFAIDGTNLVITDSANNTLSVSLASIAASVNTDNQNLDLIGAQLNITDGTGVDLTKKITTAMLADATNANSGVFYNGTDWVYETRVKSVNNNTPDANGNVTIPIGNVYTGPTSDIAGFNTEIGGTPNEGDIYVINGDAVDTTKIGHTYIYDADTTSWVEIDPFNATLYDPRYVNVTGDAMTGNLDLGNNQITGLGDPLNTTDAVNKKYVDQFNITDVLATGNKIATITEADGTVHTLNETITGLSLTGNTLSYTNETGTVNTIDLSSTNTNTTNVSLLKDGNNLKLTDSEGNVVSVSLVNLIPGKALTSTDLSISTDGASALLKDVTIDIKENAVTTAKILDKNVTLAKLANGTANQVLKTNAAGDAAEWVTVNNSVTEVFSAEYAGATLYADGTDNEGTMTSDNAGPTGNYMNYYEWSSEEATAQDYDVAIRFTLPKDFTAWDTNPIVIDYQAEGATTFSATMFLEDGTALGSITAISSTTWATANLTPGAMSAGQTAVILLKLTSAPNDDTKKVRVGDITLNYKK